MVVAVALLAADGDAELLVSSAAFSVAPSDVDDDDGAMVLTATGTRGEYATLRELKRNQSINNTYTYWNDLPYIYSNQSKYGSYSDHLKDGWHKLKANEQVTYLN